MTVPPPLQCRADSSSVGEPWPLPYRHPGQMLYFHAQIVYNAQDVVLPTSDFYPAIEPANASAIRANVCWNARFMYA